jgi:hypothetical protein
MHVFLSSPLGGRDRSASIPGCLIPDIHWRRGWVGRKSGLKVLREKRLVRFQVLTAVGMNIRVFWDRAQCSFVHHGGSPHLWNIGLLQRDYTTLYARRLCHSEVFTHVSGKIQRDCDTILSTIRPTRLRLYKLFIISFEAFTTTKRIANYLLLK